MAVTKINFRQSKETEQVLERLLEKNRQGEISGLIFCVQLAMKEHGMGVTGDFRRNPLSAVAATSRMLHRINQRVDEETTSDFSLGL